MRLLAVALLAWLALLAPPADAFIFRGGGASGGGGGLVEIGSGVTLFNNGSTASNVPTQFGYYAARGDMPAPGNTIVCKDDTGATLPCQIDQISTRTGMPGASDTPNGWLSFVVSLIEPSWTASTVHTFHVYRQAGTYTPGTGLPVSDLTTGHDYQILLTNWKDGSGNLIGSGSFTCDLNSAIAAGARTASGGYDKTYDGSVQTTFEVLVRCTDNTGGVTDGELVAEFYVTLWQTTAGSGTLGNIQLAGFIGQPFQNSTRAAFTGSISSTTLCVTAVSSGEISVGETITGSGVTAGTQITAQSGSCGSGTPYQVSASQTVASESMTVRPEFTWGDVELFDASTSTVLRTFSNTTTFASSSVTISPAGGFGVGTMPNTDSIQAGEALTFSSTGALPTGLSNCTPCFAMETVGASNVPGAISVTRNAGINQSGASSDYVSITSQGSGTISVTRHVGIDQFDGTWLDADDKGHPFWVGGNSAQIYPCLDDACQGGTGTAQRTYCETTALCPPFLLASWVAPPPNPWPVFSNAGGPLYRSHSLGPQEISIDSGGTHMGLGEWGNVEADWLLTQSVANWDILRALALSQSGAVLHHVLNSVTGYMTAYDNGPYPSGGTYSKLGTPLPLDYNIGPTATNSLDYHDFSVPAVPAGINDGQHWNYGPFGGALSGANSPNSHEPDFGNAAVYTIMGEPEYLRSLQMEANFSILAHFPVDAPSGTNPTSTTIESRALAINSVNYYGLVFNAGETPRGPAWALRNIVDGATLGADGDWNRAYLWSEYEENVDAWYAFYHLFWFVTDPNIESIGVLDFPQSFDFTNNFMYPYQGGSWAAAYGRTHYASGTLAGAGALYGLNFALTLPVIWETTWGTVSDAVGHVVCPYWGPQEEGMAQAPSNLASFTPALPGNPAVATGPGQIGVSFSGTQDGWRASTYSTSGVLTPNGTPSASGTQLVQNGDAFIPQNIDGPATVNLMGTTTYYAVDVIQGSSTSVKLTTTPPTTQACSGPTGSTGCPSANAPTPASSTSTDFSWRPQACPAAPAAANGINADTAGYAAELDYDFKFAKSVGATLPNLSTALSNNAARYNPTTVNGNTSWSWMMQLVTVP